MPLGSFFILSWNYHFRIGAARLFSAPITPFHSKRTGVYCEGAQLTLAICAKRYYKMNCIEIICLYLKRYISEDQFQNIFYDYINDFENALQGDIYLDILSTNFESKERRLTLETELYNYVLENYSLVYDKINDAYLERLIDSNKGNVVVEILKKRYERRDEVSINCDKISKQSELICSVKKALEYPQFCGNNWDAIRDLIFDIILPEKFIFYNWDAMEEKLPEDTAILKSILDKIREECCIIIYA